MVPRQWSPSQVLAVSGAVVRRGVRAVKTSWWETLSVLGGPFLPTPLDRLKIQNLAIFAEPPSRRKSVSLARIPTT